MKLLKIKSYLIGFIVLVLLTIPISKTDALEVEYPRNDVVITEKWIYENIYLANDISIENYPYVYMTYFPGSTNYNPSLSFNLYHKDETVFNRLYASTDTEYDLASVKLSKSFYGITVNVSGIGIFNVNFYERGSSYAFKRYYKTQAYYGDYQYFYSNFDIVDCNTGEILKTADIGKITDTPIELSYNYANDLNGIYMASMTVDFGSYEEGKTYQIKIGNNDWVDITNDIAEIAQEGYYYYRFNQYYNTTVEARILNGTTETNSNSIEIIGLHDFGVEISSNEACDSLDRDIHIIKFDLNYCWSDDYIYQYSFDNKTFYSMDVSKETKNFMLNHGINTPVHFRILDNVGNEIYDDIYIFSGLKKEIIKIENASRINNKNVIEIKFDFSEYHQFSDMYNIKYYVKMNYLDGEEKIIELDENAENYNLQLDSVLFDNFSSVEVDVYVDNYKVDTSRYSNSRLLTFNDEYTRIQEEKLNEELNHQDYSNISNMVESVKDFINAISEFVTTFFELIMYFFNLLNVWIKTCIIALFIELVIFKTIKAVRK